MTAPEDHAKAMRAVHVSWLLAAVIAVAVWLIGPWVFVVMLGAGAFCAFSAAVYNLALLYQELKR